MHHYQQLSVWQKAVDFSVLIYQLTQHFPGDEKYGLTSQVRRASISIASNIAEGAGRNSQKDFKNFLAISIGSACELETQLLIARKVGILSDEDYVFLCSGLTEIKKMLYSLQNKL